MKQLLSTLSVLALLAAPAAIAQGAPATATAKEIGAPRHADWTAILAKYVKSDGEGLNLFDYGALKASAADSAALDAYINRLAALDIDKLPRDEQFVTWGNLYNAVTIQHMIGRYPVKSIRSGYIVGPWKDVGVEVKGRGFVSLDDMEHAILRANWDEPRIHYMVNCASIGCPNLKASAWETANLEAELDKAARAFVNHPRGVTIRKDGRLQVSSIYKWFQEDFGGSKDGVIAHVLKYADADLAAAIRAKPDIRSYKYDWDINDTSR